MAKITPNFSTMTGNHKKDDIIIYILPECTKEWGKCVAHFQLYVLLQYILIQSNTSDQLILFSQSQMWPPSMYLLWKFFDFSFHLVILKLKPFPIKNMSIREVLLIATGKKQDHTRTTIKCKMSAIGENFKNYWRISLESNF